jgi:hypothetical protein
MLISEQKEIQMRRVRQKQGSPRLHLQLLPLLLLLLPPHVGQVLHATCNNRSLHLPDNEAETTGAKSKAK